MGERIGIIGGGIVGIALARALLQRGLGEVTVFEKEHRLAAHQTGHNSGVVHAGLYYAAGSLKARLCVSGREALREYCQDKNLPYREVGKLVVAVDESELPALAEIEKRSRANGCRTWTASTMLHGCGTSSHTRRGLRRSTRRTPPSSILRRSPKRWRRT